MRRRGGRLKTNRRGKKEALTGRAIKQTGEIIYEVQFFCNFNLSKKIAENIFFLTNGMFEGRYSSGGKVGAV